MYNLFLKLTLAIFLAKSVFLLNETPPNLPSLLPPPKIRVEPFCNQELLAAFQFKGLATPSPDPLLFCPDINLSCCTKTDQIIIYENFVKGNEEEEMNTRFKYIQSIYEDFLLATATVHNQAAKLLQKYSFKKISNCRIFAQRIQKFETQKIFPRLKVAIKQMHSFYVRSYKGVYCSVCDATNHQFFDLTNPDQMEINFSQKFCRDIIARSLYPLIYFETHLIKYANLLTEFSSFCNSMNRFEDGEISSYDKILPKQNRIKMLENCRQNLNIEDKWFEHCEPVCKKYNFLKYNPFFSPNLKEYRKSTLLLNELSKRFKKLSLKQKQLKKGRTLSENKTTKNALASNNELKNREQEAFNFQEKMFQISEREVAEIERRFPTDFIIKSALATHLDPSMAESMFDEIPGLNPYKVGRSTKMVRKLYEIILKSPENLKDNQSKFWFPEEAETPETVSKHLAMPRSLVDEGLNPKQDRRLGNLNRTGVMAAIQVAILIFMVNSK